MRTVIVSDVHANLAALEAVLSHAESGGRIDAVWSLGDCVGYGPQPSECIARLRGFAAVMIAGAPSGGIVTDANDELRGRLGADDGSEAVN